MAAIITAACMAAAVVVAVGLKLLGASSEVISLGLVLLLGLGGLASGIAFDVYSVPPDRR